MKISQQIPKPENRQDFESLCKRLRWEIWICSEIKKNWRQWQNQNGVDIYGIPEGREQYFGIQCKGKDDYIHAQLSKKEIDEEIEKAKKFKPLLAKFYFATTANKDAKIEEYIRLKNIEHREKWLFELDLYSWEDIVDLIKENKNTYNYYVNSINFLNQHSVELSFEDETHEMNANVIFLRTKKIYKHKIINPLSTPFQEMIANMKALHTFPSIHPLMEDKGENLSKFDFRIKVKNTGTTQLDNYKINLEFEWEIEEIWAYIPYFPTPNRYVDCYIRNKYKTGLLEEPKDKFLIPADAHTFDEIYCIPHVKTSKITVNRSFLSKEFKCDWQLHININIKIIDNEELIEIKSSEEEKEEIIIERLYYNQEMAEKLKKQLWGISE